MTTNRMLNQIQGRRGMDRVLLFFDGLEGMKRLLLLVLLSASAVSAGAQTLVTSLSDITANGNIHHR